MKTTNIRELKHATSTVLDWVQQGETVQITRYNKVVGIIVPPSAEIDDIPEEPDFYERLEKLFFDTSKPMTGTELISYSRGER
jgi:antitoxin (DNA-binding transcriptional repressor) of toxin-antitoxin stability system